MKAARISAPKQFEIMDVDMPEVNEGECLVKLERWSICGSDIRHAYGPVHPEEEYPMRVGRPLPRVRRNHRGEPLGPVPRGPACHRACPAAKGRADWWSTSRATPGAWPRCRTTAT